jgi:putative Mn2+ efflux pump MntP
MKLLKFLLLIFALVFVIWGAWALLGAVAGLLYALVKWAVIIGVVALAGMGAYKLLSGPDREEQAALSPAEAEMLKAERLLADLRRKELTK